MPLRSDHALSVPVTVARIAAMHALSDKASQCRPHNHNSQRSAGSIFMHQLLDPAMKILIFAEQHVKFYVDDCIQYIWSDLLYLIEAISIILLLYLNILSVIFYVD